MWHKKHLALVGASSAAIALATPALAAAGTNAAPKPIRVTQRITTLYSTTSGQTNVGTSDGSIAGSSVHGALRATSTSSSASTFTATGTLFYQSGTLSYTLDGKITRKPNGSFTVSGSGTFTGGSSRFSGAHGSFSFSGAKPAHSFETWKLVGTVRHA